MGAESENRKCRVGEANETGAPDAISQGGKLGEVWGCRRGLFKLRWSSSGWPVGEGEEELCGGRAGTRDWNQLSVPLPTTPRLQGRGRQTA